MRINRLFFIMSIGLAEFNISAQAPDIVEDTDSLFSHFNLDEIVVKAVRPFQKISKGGTVIDVRNTSLSKSGLLTDILDRMPQVNKTKEGYEVLGKGSPIIYIDGRRVYDITEMSNLRSEQISDIELITNPGPEYDAKVFSVIKIRTIIPEEYGFGMDAGIVYAGIHNSDITGLLNANYSSERFDISETFKYSNKGEMENQYIYQTANLDKFIAQKSRYKVSYRTCRLDNTLALNYRIAPTQLVGLSYNISVTPSCNYAMTMHSDISDGISVTDRLTNIIKLHRIATTSHQVNTHYTGNFSDWNTKIAFDYLSSSEGQAQNNEQCSESSGTDHITAYNKRSSHLYALRTDVTRRINHTMITGGMEFNLTRRSDSYRNSDPLIGSSDGLLNEKMLSAYVTCNLPTIAGEFSAGLRYEHSSFSYRDQDVLHRNHDNVFPSVNWQKRFGLLHLSAGYSSKIQRPRYKDLSNEVIYVNSFCLSTGNPLLRNSLHHEISLMTRWRTLTLSSSLRRTSDAIVYWGESYEHDNSITLLTMDNIKHLTKSITTITWAPVIGRFSPVISSSCIKQWLYVAGTSFNHPIFTASLTNSFDCGKGWTAMLDFNYRSKGNTENAMLNDNIFNLSASLRKSFDRWTIQLKVTDIINDCSDNNTIFFPHHTLTQITKWDSRCLLLSMHYNLRKSSKKSNNSKSEMTNKNRL